MRVLVVEDEHPLADAIARGLRREGMAVDVAYDGDTAIDGVSGLAAPIHLSFGDWSAP